MQTEVHGQQAAEESQMSVWRNAEQGDVLMNRLATWAGKTVLYGAWGGPLDDPPSYLKYYVSWIILVFAGYWYGFRTFVGRPAE